jgi:hypothetical protein
MRLAAAVVVASISLGNSLASECPVSRLGRDVARDRVDRASISIPASPTTRARSKSCST